MPQTDTIQPASARRRILIVDEHPLIRRGLKALIDAEPDLIVCAEAATRDEALRAVAAERPDLVILDPSIGRGEGFGLIGEICARFERLPVLALCAHESPDHVRRALAAGAVGCVAKGEATGLLLDAIRAAPGSEDAD